MLAVAVLVVVAWDGLMQGQGLDGEGRPRETRTVDECKTMLGFYKSQLIFTASTIICDPATP